MKTRAWALKFPPRVLLRGLLLLTLLAAGWSVAAAQSVQVGAAQPQAATSDPNISAAGTSSLDSPVSATSAPTTPAFRVEKLSIAGGSELLTIFGRVDGLRHKGSPEVPLVTVLRDTLGDDNPENDRLRYVWMLTYTQPTLLKRIAAAVPFLYGHIGNQTRAANRPPPPLIDLANADRQTWNNIFRLGLQDIVLDNL